VARRLAFHIQQNTTPKRVEAILRFAAGEGGEKVDKSALAADCGLAVSVLHKVVLPFVRQVGLLDSSYVTLTSLGEDLYHISVESSSLFAEAMHCVLYTNHTFDAGKRFSWAYAKVVDALWGSSERVLDGTTTAQLVGMVVDEAAQAFEIPVEQVAFSKKSVRGVLNWLRALDPPVAQRQGKHETFRRRYFCPIPTFLWGMDFLYRLNETPYGIRLFLTEERIEQVCKLCVLDPSGLDNVLAMAKRMYDYERGEFFDYGTTGGFGRWVLLSKAFGFGDVASSRGENAP